jgi:hypothetical protein
VRLVTGDRFGGEWPAERFRRHRVTYASAEKPKSQLYGEFLPLLNSGVVELLDDKRLVAQFLALERRTAWGGRDSIDHAPGQHDDVVNAAAGALVLAAGRRRGGLAALGPIRVETVAGRVAPPELAPLPALAALAPPVVRRF